MIKIENWNAIQIVPIHSSEYFSIIKMYQDLVKHSNLEREKYLVNSEFVWANLKLKQGIIERYKDREGSLLMILITSVISYKLFIFK